MGNRIPLAVAEDGALYKSEAKIYPREVDGRFQRLRTLAVWWLLGMYYLFPWLKWDGRQAVLFDLPARKFYLFGLNFWPQDFFFLAVLLILAGLSLFFFTALAGRLWCGYACPQTVWTETFLWIERFFEGGRHRQIKLDAAPWTREKLLRKSGKHLAWAVFSLWTGFTFVGFFTPIGDLAARLWVFQWGGWETFWTLFYALATWGNAGFLREQVCKYMCPYARFQSAMFDRNTLLIAYDEGRGEPRGPRRRGAVASVLFRDSGLGTRDSVESRDSGLGTRDSMEPGLGTRDSGLGKSESASAKDAKPKISSFPLRPSRPLRTALSFPESRVPSPESRLLGDCIDCTLCVQVCPTGIDIRDGLQYECIACGACIDACDAVMDRMGYPRGLIRYSTQNAIDGKPSRVLRPRVVVYGLLLAGIFGAWTWGVLHRAPLLVDVLRDRNALYRLTADGRVENAYTLKIVNKTPQDRHFLVQVRDEEPAARIRLVGAPVQVAAAAEDVVSLAVTLEAPLGLVRGKREVHLVVADAEHPELRRSAETRFFGPLP